jgi:DNA-binding transcriptional LysR family regulator
MVTDATFDADVIARKITSTEAILVASPGYIQRKGKPITPEDLANHDILQFKTPRLRPGVWRLFNSARQDEPLDLVLEPSLWVNDHDTLLRAALDGAGITSTAVELVAPYLSRGELVRVLSPWITDRLCLYAALASRKFLPERTRVFLDYLSERIRTEIAKAMQACETC